MVSVLQHCGPIPDVVRFSHVGFVRWASEEVEIYAETFRRQVYGADQDRKVIEESLEVTKAHGAMVRSPSFSSTQGESLTIVSSQLRDVGLDFTFLLDGLLRPQHSPALTTSASNLTIVKSRPPSESHRAPGNALAKARQSVFVANSK